MAFILRTLSFFVILGCFIAVVFSSFFSQSKDITFPDFIEVFNEFESLSTATGSSFERKSLSLFESYFYTGATVKVDKQSSNFDMQLSGTGAFVSSLRDITKTYSIGGNGYRIIQEGIGEIYVDLYSVPGKILVFPLNTSLKLELINDTGTQVYSTLYLTPHMYIAFDPQKGKFLKNADVVRMQTVYELGYLGASLQNIFENSFFIDYSLNIDGFFQDVLGYTKKRDTKLQAQIHLLEEQNIYKLPGIETIEKYSSMFINEEKKKIFYQNRIVEGYIKILKSKSYKQTDISELEKDLLKLSNISTPSYDFMKSMGYQINAALNTSYEKDHTISKISFAKLLSSELDEKKWYFSMYGFSLYSLYDTKNIFSTDMSEKYLQSFKDFQTLEAKDKVEHTLRSQYFSFFLEKQLLHSLQSEKKSDTIENMIDIFERYLEISKRSYETNNTMKITRLYIYAEILENIDIFLRTRYFDSERTQENLLKPNINNKLSSQEVEGLYKQTEEIFTIYQDTKDLLSPSSPRDNTIQKSILLSKRHMDEYFLAMSNYLSYKSKYDVSKQGLLDVEVGTEDDLNLSEEKVRAYLSSFVGLEISGMQVEIKDNYYYEIQNVFVGGKKFSFHLYPYLSYKIQNINIDNQEIKFAYKLGLKEIEWKEIYEKAPIEEKDLYDFSRFFLITFIQSPIIKNIEEYIPDEIKFSEDSTEIVFKRDILLGDKGEFRNIKGILPLKYENLRVTKNGDAYDIFIENAGLIYNVPSLSDKENKYTARFNSQYILSEKEHVFRNIRMNIQKQNSNAQVIILGDSEVVIFGNIDIENFNTVIDQIFSYIAQYQIVYEAIEGKYDIDNLTLQYNSTIQKMTFKFDSGQKNYTILLRGDIVEKIYAGKVNTLDTPISSNEIQLFLP